MNKLALALLAGIAAASVSACATDGVKLGQEDLSKALVGNTSESVFTVGGGTTITNWTYYAPEGTFVSENSKGEQGHGTYSIKDGQLCRTWTKAYYNWTASNGCSAVSQDGKAYQIDGRYVPQILPGNAKKLSYKG